MPRRKEIQACGDQHGEDRIRNHQHQEPMSWGWRYRRRSFWNGLRVRVSGVPAVRGVASFFAGEAKILIPRHSAWQKIGSHPGRVLARHFRLTACGPANIFYPTIPHAPRAQCLHAPNRCARISRAAADSRGNAFLHYAVMNKRQRST
jgi:hypothetical protein